MQTDIVSLDGIRWWEITTAASACQTSFLILSSATENTDLAAVYEAYGTVRINIDGGRNFKINGKSYTSDNIEIIPLHRL